MFISWTLIGINEFSFHLFYISLNGKNNFWSSFQQPIGSLRIFALFESENNERNNQSNSS